MNKLRMRLVWYTLLILLAELRGDDSLRAAGWMATRNQFAIDLALGQAIRDWVQKEFQS